MGKFRDQFVCCITFNGFLFVLIIKFWHPGFFNVICFVICCSNWLRYTQYNNGDLNVYTDKYTPPVYAYTPQGMATFDLGSTTDFVDSTTFDQRQPIDALPDTNGLLSTTVTPATITNNSHLGMFIRFFYFVNWKKKTKSIIHLINRITSKNSFWCTHKNLSLYNWTNRWHDEKASRLK